MNNNLIDKIKTLRLKTGISFIECKKALIETNLNIDEAIIHLRRTGALNALKRTEKIATEGLISSIISNDRNSAVIIEINCETDFVSKSEEFIEFCDKISKYFLNNNENKFIDLKKNDITLPEILENEKINIISKFKENIIINKIKKIYSDEDQIFGYVHGTSSYGKFASLLTIEIKTNDETTNDTIKDIAMQIVAMNPYYLDIESIPKDLIENEKNIITDNIKKTYKDKSEEQINNIKQSLIKKFYEDIVLLEQPYIKNQKIKIKDIIKNFIIKNFIRFEVGEKK